MGHWGLKEREVGGAVSQMCKFVLLMFMQIRENTSS